MQPDSLERINVNCFIANHDPYREEFPAQAITLLKDVDEQLPISDAYG